MDDDPDGWGQPRLAVLRSVAATILLVCLIWLVVVEPGPNDTGAIGTLLGALLILLGFEAGLRWPGAK